jgi:hypothetical protein
MTEPWGEILYRVAAITAGLVVLLAVLNFRYNVGEGEPIMPVAALGLGAIIWLAGGCCRYLLGAPGPHRR